MAELPRQAALGFHHVVADLREQLLRYESLDAAGKETFTFSITSDEARAAIEEFHRTSCAAERQLDRSVAELFAPDLEKILVTVSPCPTLAVSLPSRHHVRRSHVIGQHIPEEVYEDLLNTPDQRISDAFRPACAYCPHERGAPRQHPAMLSYLRHVPADLVALRIRLDDHDGNIQGMEHRIATKRLMGVDDEDREIRSLLDCIETEMLAKERTERALSEVAAVLPYPFVQVKGRLKGTGRVSEKAVDAVFFGGELTDHIGIQCVSRFDDLEQTKRYASSIVELLRARDARSLLSPLRYDESKNGVWRGYKFLAHYGDNGLVIPISFQFLPLATYWRERVEHPFYEERRQRKLDDLRAQGKPIDRMLRAVEEAFTQAAADWRAVHASSS